MRGLMGRWDKEVGLFAQTGAGHTSETARLGVTHSIPNNLATVVYAALRGKLQELNFLAILEAARARQVALPGEGYGQFPWYLEESKPCDSNAAFFITMSLFPLRKYFAAELGPQAVALLDEMLDRLSLYFANAARGKHYYYPNKFLGDIVFAILLEERAVGAASAETLAILDESAHCWLDGGWGWGEHLSDGYSNVCLHEISMLLLMSEQLPAASRGLCLRLLGELLDIEDQFGGKPRVPAIRSYAFEATPHFTPFRSLVRQWGQDETFAISNMPPLGPLFDRLGWHGMAPPQAAPRQDIAVKCHGGAVATARVLPDIRLGSMSRYPIMPNAEHQQWGLSWQSFPFAFLHEAGDWGFLQWESREGGFVNSHPFPSRSHSLRKSLTASSSPPVAGQFAASQRGGAAVVLRFMPSIPAAWERLSDRLRVVALSASHEERTLSDNCSVLALKWPGRTLWVARFSFGGSACHRPAKVEHGALDWDLEWSATALEGSEGVACLWGFSLDVPIDSPPTINSTPRHSEPTPCEELGAKFIAWDWGDIKWRLSMDVSAPAPLSNA